MHSPPTPTPLDPFALLGCDFQDRIRIVSVAARGGFGLIYQGFHVGLQRPVALKVFRLLKPNSEEVWGRAFKAFFQEAQLTARLNHPAIVKVYDFGQSPMPSGESAPWMLLEWLEGTTLARILQQRAANPYSPSEALKLLRPVFDALAQAHEQHGIVHLDVSPSNIFVCDAQKRDVRLIDFGIAHVLEPGVMAPRGDARPTPGITAFSPNYPSPEQVRNARTGPWTDVHALGLILSHMLTGKLPYTTHDFGRLTQAVLHGPRPTPASRGVDVGPWEPVLARALALDPSQRHASAREFLDELERTLPVTEEVLRPGWKAVAAPSGTTSRAVENDLVVHGLELDADRLREPVTLPFSHVPGLLPAPLTVELHAGLVTLVAAPAPGTRIGLFLDAQKPETRRARYHPSTDAAPSHIDLGHRSAGIARIECVGVQASQPGEIPRVDVTSLSRRFIAARPSSLFFALAATHPTTGARHVQLIAIV